MGTPAYALLAGLCAEFDSGPGTLMRHPADRPGGREPR